MPHFFPTSFLLLAFAWGISAQTLPVCGTGCFQGTPENATTPGDASLCPLAAGIANPFLTSSCLCFTPQAFDGTPFTFCFTCGQETTGDFSDICGSSQVTQSCSNQQDVVSEACNANSDVNEVLGTLCEDGKPTSTVTDVGEVVKFVQPELAAGALSLITLGCMEVQIGQAVSDVVSDLCTVWNIAGCGTVDAASASPSNPASTSTGNAASITTGKAASTNSGKAASTSSPNTVSTGASSAVSANTGIANATSTNAAATSTTPAGSSTGSATTLLSDLHNISYMTLSLSVASIWVLLVY